MLDRLVASIPGAQRGFRLVFSATPFPGHTVKLEWRREESGGNPPERGRGGLVHGKSYAHFIPLIKRRRRGACGAFCLETSLALP